MGASVVDGAETGASSGFVSFDRCWTEEEMIGGVVEVETDGSINMSWAAVLGIHLYLFFARNARQSF
jgi:hypothetical protein